MNHNTTIRSEIEKCIRLEGLTLQRFAMSTGLNVGTLSAILNRNPPRTISIQQLDIITERLGMPEGALYELYVDDCFVHSIPHWRRLRPFMQRCAELDRLDCIRSMLGFLVEDLANIRPIFETAELMLADGWEAAARLLYDCVIECEKYSHSERLAICHYRVFRITCGQDTEANLWAAVRFEPYRKLLPLDYQLDALMQLLRIYYTVHKWDYFDSHADELIQQVGIVYEEELKKNKRTASPPSELEPLRLEKTLVYYYGQAYLSKAMAQEKLGLYESAKSYIQIYSDLSWFELLDEEGHQEVEKLTRWAQANTYAVDMLMGNSEVIENYSSFLKKNKDETLLGLTLIIQSANKYGFTVDKVLHEFAQEMLHFKNDFVNMERQLRFHYQLAIYLLTRGDLQEGIEHNLQALEIAIQAHNLNLFAKCVTLFEYYRKDISVSQSITYSELMKQAAAIDVTTYTAQSFGVV